jgi:hypothetical protein
MRALSLEERVTSEIDGTLSGRGVHRGMNALSLGERVAHDGVFVSRRGSGEGLFLPHSALESRSF